MAEGFEVVLVVPAGRESCSTPNRVNVVDLKLICCSTLDTLIAISFQNCSGIAKMILRELPVTFLAAISCPAASQRSFTLSANPA